MFRLLVIFMGPVVCCLTWLIETRLYNRESFGLALPMIDCDFPVRFPTLVHTSLSQMRKLVTDVKFSPGKEVALQHQLLVCDMRFDVPPKPKSKFTPGPKV